MGHLPQHSPSTAPKRASNANARARTAGRALAPAMLLAIGGLWLGFGCQSTQFYNEGPGQPTDRARGTVPAGSVGVCRRPFTRRPPIVNPELWENTKLCNSRTPESYIRLGFGHKKFKPEAVRTVERMMVALREGQADETGNDKMLTMLRVVREQGSEDPLLRDRVSKNSSRTSTCDFTYMLNTMEKENERLQEGDKCAATAYDTKKREDVCLFDTQLREAVWLTSAWSCVTRANQLGKEESCHRLCAYDDYCARQVSCVAPDIDLVLCAMGVCLPEARDGIF